MFSIIKLATSERTRVRGKRNNKLKPPVKTDSIFETGAFGVPSKSQKSFILMRFSQGSIPESLVNEKKNQN